MSLSTDEIPDVVHFYSYETGVSFELPLGFEVQSEEPGVAGYLDEDEDDESKVPARVLVQVVGTVESGDPAAAQQAVDALAHGFAAQGGDVLTTRTELIDEAPTATTILRRTDAQLGGEVLFHQTAAASHGKLLSISAIAPIAEQARYRPAFDAAIRSVRFIQL